MNDGPIIHFSPDAEFPLDSDRNYAVGFAEEDKPVNLIPNATTIFDVDSTYAGGATIQLHGIIDKMEERLIIDKLLADIRNISINVSSFHSSFNITLVGIASFEVYRQVEYIVSTFCRRVSFHIQCTFVDHFDAAV